MSRILSLCLTASLCLAAFCALPVRAASDDSSGLGLFEGHSDVGDVLHPGSARYDSQSKAYTLTGSGENMWLGKDQFQFVWKKVSAEDISLTADVTLPGKAGDNHRKAVLMIRQSLDADSPYADVARHGDGLTSLQFREAKGEMTHEVESNMSGPARLRIVKRGDQFYMWIASAGENLRFAGGSTRVALKAPFYVGLGVCAHNKDAVQTAVFTNVELNTASSGGTPVAYRTLETVAVSSTDARVAYVTQEPIESGSWSADGKSLLFRANGKLKSIPLTGGTPESAPQEPVPSIVPANGEARVSPDGMQSAALSSEDGQLVLTVTPAGGKEAKVVAKFTGVHGSLGSHPWSPDGKRLAFISTQSVEKE